MNGGSKEKASIEELKKRIEVAEKRKKYLIEYLQKLNQQYEKGKIPYSLYIETLYKKKDSKSLQEWVDYYNSYIKECELLIKKQKTKKRLKIFLIMLGIVIILLVFFMLSPSLKSKLEEVFTQWSPKFLPIGAPPNETPPSAEEPPLKEVTPPEIEQPEEIPPPTEEIIPLPEIPTNVTPPIEIEISEENITEPPANITEIPEENITEQETNITEPNITEIPEEIPSPPIEVPTNITPVANITIENITTEDLTIITLQESAVLGQPVKWVKKITSQKTGRIKIKIPENARDIKINKLKEGQMLASPPLEEKRNILEIIFDATTNLLRKILSALTGRAVETTPKEIDFEIEIDDITAEYQIEYFTDAPSSTEQETEKGKSITILNPSGIAYKDVLSFTSLSESFNVKNPSQIKIYWTEKNTYLQIEKLEDIDSNGIYDQIQWVIPQLENEANFEIILIIKAEHLNSDREFISNIYEEVKELDGIWSEEIPDSHYVRVTFQVPLDSTRDITLYPRIISGNPKIEVYEINGNELIATFESLTDNEYNKVFLTNLQGEQDTFDLKILNGSIEIDHIIDPQDLLYVDDASYCGPGTCTLITPNNATGPPNGLPATAEGAWARDSLEWKFSFSNTTKRNIDVFGYANITIYNFKVDQNWNDDEAVFEYATNEKTWHVLEIWNSTNPIPTESTNRTYATPGITSWQDINDTIFRIRGTVRNGAADTWKWYVDAILLNVTYAPNLPPLFNTLTISPTTAYTNDTIRCSFNITDGEQATLNVTAFWSRSGNPIFNQTITYSQGKISSLNLSYEYTKHDKIIECNITASDGIVLTSSVANVNINNYSSSLKTTQEPGKYVNDNILFTANYSSSQIGDIKRKIWNSSLLNAGVYSATFYDCNGEGKRNCMAVGLSTGTGRYIYFFNKTGEIITSNFGMRNIVDIKVADLNKDGRDEIVAISSYYPGDIRVFYSNGIQWWSYGGNEYSTNYILLEDINQDGNIEIIIGQAFTGKVLAFNYAGSHLWNYSTGGQYIRGLVFGNFSNKGVLAYAGGGGSSTIGVLNASGGLVWNSLLSSGEINVINLDTDVYDEILVGNNIRGYDNNGNLLWQKIMDDAVRYEIEVSDIDNDRTKEFIISDRGGFSGMIGILMVYNASNTDAIQEWNYTRETSTPGAFLAMSIIAKDIDDNENNEIVFGGGEGIAFVLNSSGRLIYQFPVFGQIGSTDYSAPGGRHPAIDTSDFNNDGINDVLVGSGNSYAYIFQDANCIIEFNDSVYANMTWNSSSNLWEFDRSFGKEGTYKYNITCEKGGYTSQVNATSIGITSGPITFGCGYTINSPGTYYIQADEINYNLGTCITINSSNVLVDCQGHILDGMDSAGTKGVYAHNDTSTPSENITIQNCNLNDWADGIHLERVNKNIIENINVSSNVFRGIYLQFSNRNILRNINSTLNGYGFSLSASTDNNLTSIIASSNNFFGLTFADSSRNNVINSTISNQNGIGDIGIQMWWVSSLNQFINNTITNNYQGIYFNYNHNRNNFSSNLISNNTLGINITNEYNNNDNNYFWNNLINNTNNFFIGTGNDNFWNTTLNCLSGPNIIGGACIGGNYWNNYIGYDIGGGIGNNTYRLDSNDIDYLPLVYANLPKIIYVSPIAPGEGVYPIEESPKPINFNFTMYDPNGINDLNDSSVRANFTRLGESTRENNSCIPILGETTGIYKNYTCAIGMWYWDQAGNWNISIYGEDNSRNSAINRTTFFQYNILSAIVISPNNINFNIQTSQINQVSNNDPTVINNTGNAEITSGNIRITGIDLYGVENDPSKFINVSNISVSNNTGGSPPAECSGTRLQNQTARGIIGATLSRGNLSLGGETAQERLYYCVVDISGIPTQTYSTQRAGSWTIEIVLSAVAILSLGRNRKGKYHNNKILKLLKKLTQELKQDYSKEKEEIIKQLTNAVKEEYGLKKKEILYLIREKELEIPINVFSKELGGLETISKYMKENLNLSYREIAHQIGRDERTIWVSYKKAIEKQKEPIKIRKAEIILPLSIFQNKKLTILEAVISYLKEKGMRYNQIAELLHRDQRNIWTIYSRAIKK